MAEQPATAAVEHCRALEGFHLDPHCPGCLDGVAIEAEAASTRAPAVDVLAPIRGLRITADQIRDALTVLGPTGDKAEAYVKAAAQAAADTLARLSALTEGRDPTEDEIREYRLDAADPENRRLNYEEWRAHQADPSSEPEREERTDG